MLFEYHRAEIAPGQDVAQTRNLLSPDCSESTGILEVVVVGMTAIVAASTSTWAWKASWTPFA